MTDNDTCPEDSDEHICDKCRGNAAEIDRLREAAGRVVAIWDGPILPPEAVCTLLIQPMRTLRATLQGRPGAEGEGK